jgi:hypothetical protein
MTIVRAVLGAILLAFGTGALAHEGREDPQVGHRHRPRAGA